MKLKLTLTSYKKRDQKEVENWLWERGGRKSRATHIFKVGMEKELKVWYVVQNYKLNQQKH